ncbi:MAG: amidohydrolase family protein [Nitrososphaerota archaeon]|nr:amidohydrolase family protein [Nitrososphaerota archaeon]
MKVSIENIGKIVSGDWDKGILKGDTVTIENGRFSGIGYRDEANPSKSDVTIDANGMVLMPGYIDPHTHISIGDYSPMQRMVGLMEEALLQGITTVMDEFNQFEGLPLFYPPDPAGVKATAIAAYRAWKNYRPGGAQKVHAGSITLVKGLKEQDFKDMADIGIWRVAQIGGSSDLTVKELLEEASFARKYGMFIPSNYGSGVLKGAVELDLDFIKKLKPDKLAHINGGSTACSWDDTRALIDETSMALELVPYGNLKMAIQIIEYLKTKGQLNRLLVGSDTPTGQGYFPVAVQRAVNIISSLGNIAAEKAIAMATGNTHDLYRKWINTGKIQKGYEADAIIIDRPPGSVGKDALGAIEAGDTVGTAMIMVDGMVVALRGRDARPTTKHIRLNGKDLGVSDPNDALFDPPRFYWKSTGETYLL